MGARGKRSIFIARGMPNEGGQRVEWLVLQPDLRTVSAITCPALCQRPTIVRPQASPLKVCRVTKVAANQAVANAR
jgi:hypothetical protein